MKTFLVSCLTGILLAASAFANSYPVFPSSTGFSRLILLANQLDETGSGNNTLNDVLPPGCGVNVGDQFLKWENTIQTYLPWSTFTGTTWVPNVSFNVTEAGFLLSAAAAVTINGAPATAPLCAPIGAGLYFNGLHTPTLTTPEAIFCPPYNDFDNMFRWQASHQSWDSTVETYIPGYGWDPPTVANVAVGEAVVYGGGGGLGIKPPPALVPTTGLQVYLLASTTPCCGQPMTYYVVVVNNALSTTSPGAVDLLLSPYITTISPYLSTSLPEAVTTANVTSFSWLASNHLEWQLLGLGAYGFAMIRLTVNVSGCIAPAVVTVNSLATLTLGTYTSWGTHTAQTLCSYDPNDKTVTPHGCGPQGLIPANTDLTYVVQFQNLGTGPASQVVIRDTLHPNLDLSSFQMLASSHPQSLFANGRELVWTFTGINLPPASTDEPGSHGFVEFKVKQNANLSPGSVITNQAGIYFDANPVVLTGMTTNTITSTPVPKASFSVSQSNPRINAPIDFTYTGGTAGASYLWDFGPGAVPATSAAQNPTGVLYTTPGPKLPLLRVSLGGCEAEPALVPVSVAGSSPRLDAQRVGSEVKLFWTDGAYHLQATPVLSSTSVWTNVPGAAPISVPIGPGMLFFRLVNP